MVVRGRWKGAALQPRLRSVLPVGGYHVISTKVDGSAEV